MEAIIAAVVSGIFSIIVALVAISESHNKIIAELDKHNAVQDTKLDALTNEVRKHNDVIRRTFKLETDVAVIKAKVGDGN